MSSRVDEAEPRRDAKFIDVLYGRRAVRSYKPEVIGEARLRALLDAAVHAPTAMHEEPWLFVVVQNPTILKRLSDAAKALARTEAAHHGRLLKRPGAAGDGIPSPMEDPDFNIFYDANTLIVICARDTGEFVAADCWLAAENLMLAARADGLGTCCIGFAVAILNSPEAKAELSIPGNVRAFAPIIVGVPRGDARVVARKPAVELSWVR